MTDSEKNTDSPNEGNASLPPSPALFTAENWRSFFKIMALDRCLHVGSSGDEGRSMRAKWGAFTVKESELTSDIWLASLRAIYQQYSTYSKTLSTYFESGYDAETVSVGVPGIFSVDASHASSHSSYQSHMGEQFYSTCRLMVPRGTVNLRLSSIEPKPQLVEDISQAVSKERMADRAEALIQVLDNYGHYVVTSSTLGGVLFATKSFTVTEDFDSQKSAESVAVGFSAKLEAAEVPVSIGGGAGAGTASGSSHGSTHEAASVNMQCNGGDPGFIHDYAKWAGSLDGDDYLHWAFIGAAPGKDVLVPVINILPKKLMIEAAQVLDTRKPPGQSDAYIAKGLSAQLSRGSF